MDIDINNLIRGFQAEIGEATGRAVIAEVKLEAMSELAATERERATVRGEAVDRLEKMVEKLVEERDEALGERDEAQGELGRAKAEAARLRGEVNGLQKEQETVQFVDRGQPGSRADVLVNVIEDVLKGLDTNLDGLGSAKGNEAVKISDALAEAITHFGYSDWSGSRVRRVMFHPDIRPSRRLKVLVEAVVGLEF